MKRTISLICVALLSWSVALFASNNEATVSWKSAVEQKGDILELVITGFCHKDWHTYSLSDKFSATTIEFSGLSGCEPMGSPYEITTPIINEDGNSVYDSVFHLGMKFKVTGDLWKINGMVTWIACSGNMCASPEDWEFTKSGKNIANEDSNKNVTLLNNNVTNDDNQVVDIIFRDDIDSAEMTRKLPSDISLVIMAGGKGTRLKPYTDVLPKPLLPIGDKTIIERIIGNFNEQGCRDFSKS